MKHKVQYYETDMMGVTHHANYIHWMEEARIDFMDQIGFPYKRMEAEGVFSPVKSIRVNYLKPCTFGDEVDVTVGVQDFNGVVPLSPLDAAPTGAGGNQRHLQRGAGGNQRHLQRGGYHQLRFEGIRSADARL